MLVLGILGTEEQENIEINCISQLLTLLSILSTLFSKPIYQQFVPRVSFFRAQCVFWINALSSLSFRTCCIRVAFGSKIVYTIFCWRARKKLKRCLCLVLEVEIVSAWNSLDRHQKRRYPWLLGGCRNGPAIWGKFLTEKGRKAGHRQCRCGDQALSVKPLLASDKSWRGQGFCGGCWSVPT